VNADVLLDAARTATGLDDYGPETDAMEEGLRRLVASVNDEADLTPEGETFFSGSLLGFLSRRLEVEDWYLRHPEVADQEIESVLFGLGLPRTGSTALSYVLAQDPDVRSLRVWEASQPTPPPELATEHSDPRFLATVEAMKHVDGMPAEMRSMLPSSADGPAECLDLMSLSFRSMSLDTMAKTPSYGHWLMTDCDFTPTYRYHRRVLQLLQSRRPPARWRLKSPAHSLSVEALDQVYPDARYVITHRDITKVIPSVASVVTAVVRMMTGVADPIYSGQHCVEMWDVSLRRLIAFRDRVGDDRFYDIGFADFQRDPIGQVRGLYEWLGEDLTPSAVAAMESWWEQNQGEREQTGGHAYRAEDFGLDEAAIAERFAYYAERFPSAAPGAR